MKRNKITAAIVSAGAAALLLVGCASGQPDLTVRQTAPERSSEQSTTQLEGSGDEGTTDTKTGAADTAGEVAAGETSLDQMISPEQAAEVALKAHPNTQVAGIDLERTRGTTAWEVKLLSDQGEWEVSVDVITGQIVKDEQEETHCSDEDCRWVTLAKLNYKQALTRMLEAVPGGQVVELEIDDEDGRPVWEADIMTDHHEKHEVKIDAETGEVLKHKGHHNNH